MANLTNTEVFLSGSVDDVSRACKFIKEHIEDSILFVSSSEMDGEYEDGLLDVISLSCSEDGQLSMLGMGRWAGPHGAIAWIAKKFNLSGTYSDSDPAMDWFRKTDFEDGEIVFDETTKYLSQLHIDRIGYEAALFEILPTFQAMREYSKSGEKGKALQLLPYLKEFADAAECNLSDLFRDLKPMSQEEAA
jgi:hypothetical protein